jgi:hypothetical protein
MANSLHYTAQDVSMPLRACPRCSAPVPRFLGDSLVVRAAWQYGCALCGHHWTVSKDDGQTIVHLDSPDAHGERDVDRLAS